MNRRNLLKTLAALPLVGWVVPKAELSRPDAITISFRLKISDGKNESFDIPYWINRKTNEPY